MNAQGTVWPVVLLASLGYFVDIFDLILFSIVRVKSLQDLGVPADQMLNAGVFLLNMQMAGMLLGGILWGILGDKRGRLSVLLASIFMYSTASILNAFVQDVTSYAVLRFLAGIGLAGELGAGITLVSEVMDKKTRAYGTTIVATVGIMGAVAAALIGEALSWKAAYIIGGVLGFMLLIMRIKASDSGMFKKVQTTSVSRGNFFRLFKDRTIFLKYLRCILIGVPLWFVVGVLITFAPEFGKAMGMMFTPSAAKAVMFAYIGLAVGDLSSGVLSQFLASRKKAVHIFMFLNAVLMGVYLFSHQPSLFEFYLMCFCLGFASGYWAVFVTIAAEQFGTNIRATVATTVPNFVRGSVVVLTLSFRGLIEQCGVLGAGKIVAVACIGLAWVALLGLSETHGKDLDYVE